MTVDQPLLVERTDEGVVTLTLALPERRNAMTEAMTAAWATAVEGLARDPSVRAVIVTGLGDVFCSGGDLAWIAAGAEGGTPQSIRARMQPFYAAWLGIRELDVPVLAAVNGAAVGAGACLALACDLRWATPDARIAVPFTALGMHPGMAATYLLAEAVGPVRARELLYTGRAVSGGEALDWGLVNGVVAAEELLPTVQAAARAIAATAPVAVRLMKAGLRPGTSRTFAEAMAWEAIAQPVTMASADFQESLAARRDKRQPVFRG